jgi:hypothetical protein
MTRNELMTQAADALRHHDVMTLEVLLDTVKQWMTDDETLDANVEMLESMLEQLELLEEL